MISSERRCARGPAGRRRLPMTMPAPHDADQDAEPASVVPRLCLAYTTSIGMTRVKEDPAPPPEPPSSRPVGRVGAHEAAGPSLRRSRHGCCAAGGVGQPAGGHDDQRRDRAGTTPRRRSSAVAKPELGERAGRPSAGAGDRSSARSPMFISALPSLSKSRRATEHGADRATRQRPRPVMSQRAVDQREQPAQSPSTK